MKNSEVKELSVAELQDKVAALQAELAKLRVNHTISPLENPMVIRTQRRTVARLLTELRKRELQGINK